MILFAKFENMPKCLYWQGLNYDEKFKNIEKREKIQRKKKKKIKEFQTPKYPLIRFPFPKRSDAGGLMKRNFYRTTRLNDKKSKSIIEA